MSIETGLLVMFVLLGTFGVWAAYRNGVNDGYNAGKYPDHPGYQKARKILEKTGQWRKSSLAIGATLRCTSSNTGGNAGEPS